jgi:hypothetical protein
MLVTVAQHKVVSVYLAVQRAAKRVAACQRWCSAAYSAATRISSACQGFGLNVAEEADDRLNLRTTSEPAHWFAPGVGARR